MLLLTAALVGPYFINWTNYRAQFEAEASKILGRTVTVEGEASARLLPFPSVTFENVTVAGSGPGRPGMTVEAFSMDAELAPFMSGEFRIFDMRLVRPHMTISVDESGAIDWAVRPSTPVDPRQISVETLTVTDGRVDLVHGPSGRTHVLAGLDATLSARTLAGPWRMDGTASLDDLPTKLVVATGAVDEGGGMRLRITATPEAYPLTLDLDGSLRFEDTRPTYAGTLRFNAQNELPEPVAEGETAKPAGPPDYRLTGAFTLTSDRLALDGARFETGPLDNPYTADGTAELSLNSEPRFRISADGAQVRFDETVAGADSQGVTLEQRIAALERVVNALPRPTIPGTVDVNLPAVVAGDTTIRDVRLSAQPAPEGWSLDTFAATLPGRTTLEGNGLLRSGADFGFSGKLLLAVAQPSGFAAWLSKDVNEAIRVLPAAGFDASVEMSRTRQQFRDLELQLGDARFRGEIDRRQPGDARPSIAMTLDGEALDVDGLAAFASIFVSDQGQTRLADHDLDFNVKAGPVRASGLVAESLDTALRLRNDRLEIDRLAIGGLVGASISATGRIDHLGSQPTGNVDASLIATDLAPLITQLSARYPEAPLLGELADRAAAYPGLFADTQLDLIASAARGEGQARGLALSAHGASGGTSMQLTASTSDLARSAAEMPIELSLNAINDDGASIVALSGLPSLPLGLLERAEATLTLAGSAREGLRTSVLLRGEDIDAGFDGQVVFGEVGPSATGEARLTAGDIEPWLMTTAMGASGMGLGTPVGVAGQVNLAEGRLTTELQGSWNHGDVEGTVVTEVINGRPHFSGNLSTAHLDIGDAAGLVLGADSLAAEADGGWARSPFANAAVLPFTTDISINTTQLEFGPGRFVTDAAFGLRLDEEGLRVSNLTGLYGGGRISGLASLQNGSGSGLLSAQLEFADADIATVTGQDVLGGRADLGISASASGKSMEGMVAALSGSGTARVRGLSIDQMNPDALPALLSAADGVGRTVDEAAVARFAPGIIGQGRYPAGDAEIAFTLANGALRMPQTQFTSAGSTLSVEGALDAVGETVQGRATVAYAPGDNALVGSEPTVSLDVSGPVETPAISYDTAALSQYLTQRALEIEQARVEAMQAQLLEQQRLRREVRYYAALQSAREEAERLRLEEEARLRAEEEARRQAEEAARVQAEQEARAAAEAEAERQETARQEAEKQAAARQEAERQAAERRQAAQNRPRQPAPSDPDPAPAPATNFQMQPLDLPSELPGSQSLTPLEPPSAPGGSGGTLPGVFENQTDG